MKLHHLALVPALVLLAGGVTACGSDDEPSAEEVVCDARQDLSTAVDDVLDDLQSANLGSARDGLPDVKTAASDLATAIKGLRGSQRDDLQPQIDRFNTDVEAVSASTTLVELQDTVGAAKASLADLISQVDTDLDCDN